MFDKILKTAVLSASIFTALSSYALPEKMLMEGDEEGGSFGAGNGGDGVVLESLTQTESSSHFTTGLNDRLQKVAQTSNQRVKQLYSLDLVDMGLATDPKIEYTTKASESSESVCIELTGCYTINNTDLFDELIDYEGFFGTPLKEIKDSIPKELATTGELAYIYKAYSAIQDEHNEIAATYFGVRLNNDNLQDINSELDRVEKRLKLIRRNFNKVVSITHKNLRPSIYSANTVLAIGLVNKIEQIRKVDSNFADLLTETLIELEWEVLNLPLNEINDEGEIAAKIGSKVQMAHRSYGVVKISNLGWNKELKINGELVLPMNTSNKIALILHEVMYEITKSQGDKTSERARLATGYLFKSNTSKRYIKKAIKLINR